MSGQHSIPGLRFLHLNPALVIQSFGIHGSKAGRHMLHAHDSRNIRSVILDNIKDRLGSSCGGADCHQQILFAGGQILLLRHYHLFHMADSGSGSNLNLHQQLIAYKIFQLPAARHCRFRHEVHRSRAHSVKNLVAERTDHHHPQGVLGHQLAQEFNSAHPGKLHIQCHDIRIMRQYGIPCLKRILRCRHHPDCRIPAQVLHQQFPKDNGIFYN